MPATYEPIATTTLGSAAASITFSSIASSWTDLRLVLVGSGDTNATLRFNSDTAANYSNTRLGGDGTAPESARQTSTTSINTTASEGLPASTPAMVTVDVFSYTGSTNKTVLITHSQDKNGSGWVARAVGLWRSTSAITTISFTATGGTALFNTGTIATLYGILKAQTMATTYTLISSNVLTSPTASITFSSIPQTYTDLVILASVRTERNVNANGYITVYFNNSLSNFSRTALRNNSGTVSSYRTTGLALPVNSIEGSNTANTFTPLEIYIPNYTNSSNKPLLALSRKENNSTSVLQDTDAVLWSGTAAITSIKLDTYDGSGENISTYSSFYLYGIKNS